MEQFGADESATVLHVSTRRRVRRSLVAADKGSSDEELFSGTDYCKETADHTEKCQVEKIWGVGGDSGIQGHCSVGAGDQGGVFAEVRAGYACD